MIQRIQSVYMLLSALVTGLLLKLKLADMVSGDQFYTFFAGGVYHKAERIFSGLPLQVFISVAVITHLVAILSYRNRVRQIRILVFAEIVLLGLMGIILYFAYGSLDGLNVSFKLPVAFPLVAVILNFLAIRAIGKDEALIRSIDRIRRKK